jgi:hypothetical protein
VRQHRPLADHELLIVERLLDVEFPEVEYFRRQVPAITVTDICPCGCGTIQFSVDPKRAQRAPSKAWDGSTGPIVESDGREWLMLFQLDGWLSELEHVPEGGLDLRAVDPATLQPDLQVEADWFT